MGLFVKYMVFRTHIYEIWKPTFNVESYMFFMHSELIAYFVSRLAFRVSRSAAFAGHVSTDQNWTDWKLQNQNLSFPQKHPSRRFFLLSFIWYPFLSSFFTPSPSWSREPCKVFKNFSHFSSETLNPICLILDFLSRGNPFLLYFAFAFIFTKIYCLSWFFLN